MSDPHTAGIYVIRNTVNGHEYVGQAFDFGVRWVGHRAELRHHRKRNAHFQRAWNLYGEATFVFEVLEVVENPTKALLTEREQYHIDTRNPVYNLRKAADSNKGLKWHNRSRRQLSRSKHLLMQNPTPALLAAWQHLREMEPTEAQLAYWASRTGKPWTTAQRAAYVPRKGEERTPAQRARDERLRQPYTPDRRAAFEAYIPAIVERLRAMGRARRGTQWTPAMREARAKRRGENLTPKQKAGYEARKAHGPTPAMLAHFERLREMEPTGAQIAYWERLKGHSLSPERRRALECAQQKRIARIEAEGKLSTNPHAVRERERRRRAKRAAHVVAQHQPVQLPLFDEERTA